MKDKKKIIIIAIAIVVLICGIVAVIGINNKANTEEKTTTTTTEQTTKTTEKQTTTEKATTTTTETETETTTEEITVAPTQRTTYYVNTTTTKKPESTTEKPSKPESSGTGVADINTGIGWNGKPIVYHYSDGTTGTEPQEGAKYEYEEGIWRVVGALEPIKDDGRCDDCGRKNSECDGRVVDWYCEICKKNIKAFECHPMHKENK